MANQYKLHITSSDYYGVNFIENIIKYSSKGAVLDMSHHIYNYYPHSCTMLISTDEFLKSELCVEVEVVKEAWTKEQLDKMSWDDVRELAKSRGITGRDRQLVTRQFLEANE